MPIGAAARHLTEGDTVQIEDLEGINFVMTEDAEPGQFLEIHGGRYLRRFRYQTIDK